MIFRIYNSRKYILVVSLVILTVCSSLNAAGEYDTSFSAAAYGSFVGTGNAIKQQADGKLLIGGSFTAANGTAAPSLIRLNLDGSVDPTFNTQNIFSALGIGAYVYSIAIQADGKILVGGSFFDSIGTAQAGVRRLNTDGSLDNSFTPFVVSLGSAVYDIEIQTDGKVIIGGSFSGPQLPENGARLNTNGSLDSGFASQSSIWIKDMELLPDGSIIVVGHPPNNTGTGIVRRLNSAGVADGSFPTLTINGRVEAVRIKANGQFLIAGAFSSINGFTVRGIALINSDGSLDLTFNQNNAGAQGQYISDIEPTADGKWMIGGSFSSYNGTPRKNIARLNENGTLDTSFSDNTLLVNPSSVNDLAVLASGKVAVALMNGIFPTATAIFNADGTVDTSFAPILSATGVVQEIAIQSDGKIFVGGSFPYINGVRRNGLARLNSNGTLDTTFVPFFNNDQTARVATALALQSDGKILVAITGFGNIFRLNNDGTQDGTFGASTFGQAEDIVPLANGQTLIAGPFGVRRLNSNGGNDSTFSTPVGGVKRIMLQPDGKILIGGTFTSIGITLRGRIARLLQTGALDDTFNPPGGANGTVEDFDLQTDGKIVLGGDFNSLNGASRLRIGRLNSDGALDNTFDQTVDGTVRSIKIQPDGKMLIGGSMGFVQAQSKVGLARLNTNGSLDNSFVSRPNTGVYKVVLQPDNKVVIGGEFILVNNNSALRIARLLNNATVVRTAFDYDGDARADVSVFRASENKWYIMRSSDSTVYQPIFAIAGDVPTPADYDGDGKTDVAIFRPSSGDWWYLSTVDGTQRTIHWGANGDVPRPSDFDGDGKADVIVFRPSENNWYRSGSTGAVSVINFGLAGDKPVTGDFDGDGKSDVAIYRPSTGDWWYRSSVNGAQLATHFGISTDTPAPADYDGDGRTDFAVYRASTGTWYILNSGNGQATVMNFGIAEDKPVAADYDGDGKADIAVFRPSTGVWYLNRSTAGFFSMQFGVSTDVPTENAYVP